METETDFPPVALVARSCRDRVDRRPAAHAPRRRSPPPSSVRSTTSKSTLSSPTGNGDLIRDLKKDDFQILEDGNAQTISVVHDVDIPVERADRPLFAAAAIEPDVKTQRETVRRARLRDGDRRPAHRFGPIAAREGGGATVHRAPSRRQRPDGRRAHAGPTDANQEFTSNKSLLLAAVDRTTVARSTPRPRTYRQALRTTAWASAQPGDPIADPNDSERATTRGDR